MGRYTSIHTMPITPRKSSKNIPFLIVAAEVLPAATGPINTRDGAGCGCGCGLGVDTAAVEALVGEWTRLKAPTGHTQGQTEGTRGSQNMRIRRKGGEFEALGQLRTFVGGPAAAQWAMAGGAPAPQLNDRSQPRPQGGNG